MNGVFKFLAQTELAPTTVLSWVAQLENSDTGKRLLAATNPDNSNYGDGTGAGPSGGGSTYCCTVLSGCISTSCSRDTLVLL